MLHEALDGAALAGASRPSNRITTRWPVVLDPGLQFEQLHLQAVFLLLVVAPEHQVFVRIAAVAPVVGELIVGFACNLLTFAIIAEQALADRLQIVAGCAVQQGAQRFRLVAATARSQTGLNCGQLCALAAFSASPTAKLSMRRAANAARCRQRYRPMRTRVADARRVWFGHRLDGRVGATVGTAGHGASLTIQTDEFATATAVAF